MPTVKLAEDRTLKLPADLCAQLNIKPGDPFLITAADGHMTITSIIERWTPERIASFHLNNAVTQEDYDWAVEEVRSMGLDPENIPGTDPNARKTLPSNAEYDERVSRLAPQLASQECRAS